MKIVTVQFDRGNTQRYLVLYKVFKKSVELCMPEAEFVTLVIEAPTAAGARKENYGFTANTYKLRKWDEYVQSVNDDVILADCDMLMLQSAKHAFDVPFDIAYTERTDRGTGAHRAPLNGGIIMVKNTREAKRFVHRWSEINDQMYVDINFHREWKGKYPGMNQAALGYMLEKESEGVRIHTYVTREWNAVDCDWGHLLSETVFVHYKGALRSRVLSGRASVGPTVLEMLLWHDVRKQLPEIDMDFCIIKRPQGGGRRSRGRARAYEALKKKHDAINAFNWVVKPDVIGEITQ